MGKEGYKSLKVWQKAVDLSVALYKLTDNFPKSEIYGLVSQIRRAGTSVPVNIAEGSAKYSGADFARFINISRGSIAEIETQLIISMRLGFINELELKKFEKDLEEINKMLFALRKAVKQSFFEEIENYEFEE